MNDHRPDLLAVVAPLDAELVEVELDARRLWSTIAVVQAPNPSPTDLTWLLHRAEPDTPLPGTPAWRAMHAAGALLLQARQLLQVGFRAHEFGLDPARQIRQALFPVEAA